MLKVKATLVQFFMLIALPLALASCGNSGIDAAKLEGTWKLKKIEGGGSAPVGFKIHNGQFEVSMAAGGFGCGSSYRVDGGRLKVDPNVTRACRLAALDIEIESVDDKVLVLKEEESRFLYDRS